RWAKPGFDFTPGPGLARAWLRPRSSSSWLPPPVFPSFFSFGSVVSRYPPRFLGWGRLRLETLTGIFYLDNHSGPVHRALVPLFPPVFYTAVRYAPPKEYNPTTAGHSSQGGPARRYDSPSLKRAVLGLCR